MKKNILKLIVLLLSLTLLTGCDEDGNISKKSILDNFGFTYDEVEKKETYEIQIKPKSEE